MGNREVVEDRVGQSKRSEVVCVSDLRWAGSAGVPRWYEYEYGWVDDHMPPSRSAPRCRVGARGTREGDGVCRRIGIPGPRSGDSQRDSDSSSGVAARHWLERPWWRPRLVQLSAVVACPARRDMFRAQKQKEGLGFLIRSKRLVAARDAESQPFGREVNGICVLFAAAVDMTWIGTREWRAPQECDRDTVRLQLHAPSKKNR